jgi:outer membrane lipoprotein
MNKICLLLLLMVLSGCAHVISEETRKQIDPNIAFSDVKKNPDPFIGKKVLVGGKVVAVRNASGSGQMEVVQFDLDEVGFPMEVSRSAGRFIATSPDFIDPAIYRTGGLITLAGEVKGKKVGTIDGAEYTFPLIGIKEIFAWKIDNEDKGLIAPSPGFYNSYNPYGYSHEDPLRYRPIGPVIKP